MDSPWPLRGPVGRFDELFVATFQELYHGRRRRFEDALTRVRQDLESLLTDPDTFSLGQQRRIRVDPGRVKSVERLLAKALLPKYETRIVVPEDIFGGITDICGIRVTCNTTSDVLAVVEHIMASGHFQAPNGIPAERCHEDFLANPKESGYRAIHLLVGVTIPAGATREVVPCEIQVRSLLQHAWGELTHEDTFKTETELPDLVWKLAKRLATTLAVLDEIAQDLRDELERLGESPITAPAVALENNADVISRDRLLASFDESFDRIAQLSSQDVLLIQREFRASGIGPDDLIGLLDKAREAVIDRNIPNAPISDRDLLLLAIEARGTQDNLNRMILKYRESSAAILDRALRFENLYPIGGIVFGTVIRVEKRYIVIQLPGGDTGISGGSGLGKIRSDARGRFSPGQTVPVKIVHVSPADGRIELQVMDV